MELQAADYILCALTLVAAILGLFRGFSGTLAFVCAVVCAGVVASLSWPYSERFIEEIWLRSAVTIVSSLLAFGLVRIIVKKLVNGLLAQPTDAIFGSLVGIVSGTLLTIAWAWSGMFLEYSTLASMAAVWLR
jgi:uncharacterized membrane protein required for colicin V production